jgi:hypothetical protein
MATIISCSERNENACTVGNSLFNPDSFKTAYVDSVQFKVYTISKIAREIKRLDSVQNGVCDTCVTGYQSSIIENRFVAKELSDRTAVLSSKIEKVDRQIRSVDSLLSSNDVQLSKLKAINKMSKREENKQRHEYYALTKSD